MARNKEAEMQEIKNIIFDFGGVLVKIDKHRCIEAFDKIGAHEIVRYVDECRQEDLFHDLEVGNTGVEEFCNEVRRICTGCNAGDADICEAWNALLTGIPRQRLEKLTSLKGRYRMVLLSNTNPIHWQKALDGMFRNDGMDVDDYFEKTYLSYRMHMLKPDPQIFGKVLMDSGMAAYETLFIDDSPVNCAAASQLGMMSLNLTGDEWLDRV
ncbi:HAD family hydrolase [Xylanibacter rarus]|uniref:HAD family hydrolase n=1 Tax=Xylanibacter rarus TaxID=1676614 RepID=UPI003FEDB9BB